MDGAAMIEAIGVTIGEIATACVIITINSAAHQSGLPPTDDNATLIADRQWQRWGIDGNAEDWAVNHAYRQLVESDNKT